MPKVVLEYEIKATGEAAVQAMVDRSMTALQQIEARSKSSAQAIASGTQLSLFDPAPIKQATAAVVQHKQTLNEALFSIAQTAHLTVNPYAKAAAQIRRTSSDTARMVSTEMVSGVLAPLSMAMGQANPIISQLALGTMRLQGGMAGATLGAKAMVGGLVALGVGAAASLMRLEELEKSAQRFAAIGKLSMSLDAGGLTQGLGEITQNRSARARNVENSWLGRTLQFWGDRGRSAIGLQTVEAEDTTAEAMLREALTRSVDHRQHVSAAQTRGQLAQSAFSRSQTTLSDLLARGLAGPDTIQIHGQKMRDALLDSTQAKLAQSELQATEERRQAAANKTIDIEGPLIKQRAAERRALLLDEERTAQEALGRTIRDAQQARAREELETQTAIAKETLERRRAGLEQVAQMEASLREAASATAIAELTGSETERATRTQAIEYQTLQASLAATQTVNAAKLADQEQFRRQQIASLQGMQAQGYLSEREYATQVRALDQELYSLKAANLQAYSAALTSALSKATSDYQRYTDQARQLDRQMRETKTGTADLVAQITQAGTSPEAALADRERRAHEKLREAVALSGEEQVAALKAVQQEFGALALEAAKAGQAATAAGKATADAFSITPSDWRSTQSGQWSQAFKNAWATQPGGIGSAEWWALGFTGSTGQIGQAAAAAERLDVRSLTRQVESVGEQILEAQQKQRDAAQTSAASAKTMVDHLTVAANEAKRLADALARAQVPGDAAASGTGTRETYAGSNDLGDWKTSVDTGAPGYVPGVTGETAIVPSGEGFAAGGYIPGPEGAVRIVKAHAGELVLNREQQAALGGPTLHFHFAPGATLPERAAARRWVRDVLVPELERVER
jgi:hypothetical protein